MKYQLLSSRNELITITEKEFCNLRDDQIYQYGVAYINSVLNPLNLSQKISETIIAGSTMQVVIKTKKKDRYH